MNAAVARLTYGLAGFVGIALATGLLLFREQLFPSLALKSRNQRALLALRMFVGFFLVLIVGALVIGAVRDLTGA